MPSARLCVARFQSTLPYGSDVKVHSIDALLLISIHAPLRERRSSMPEDQKQALISIHAPLRERHDFLRCINYPLIFQSTLPYGSDVALLCCECLQVISIHAPLRERRCQHNAGHETGQRFQSTLPYGSD